MNETAKIKPKPNKHRQQQTRWLEKGNSCFRNLSGWSRLCFSTRQARVPGAGLLAKPGSRGICWPHLLLASIHPSCMADAPMTSLVVRPAFLQQKDCSAGKASAYLGKKKSEQMETTKAIKAIIIQQITQVSSLILGGALLKSKLTVTYSP